MPVPQAVAVVLRGHRKFGIQRYSAETETTDALYLPDMGKLSILLLDHSNHNAPQSTCQSPYFSGIERKIIRTTFAPERNKNVCVLYENG